MFDGLADAAPAPDLAAPDLARLVGPEGWARLPPAVRRRFGPGHADRPRLYRGALDVHRSRAGLVFAVLALALGGPLPQRRGRGVPAEVAVRADAEGVLWERRLDFGPGRFRPGRVERVASAKGVGPDGRLVERTGGGRLCMELDVGEEGGALVFRSRRYRLRLGRRSVPLPALLTPGTCCVVHWAEGSGRFRFTLTVTHPVWGLTFHQDGVFSDPEEEPC